MKTPFIGGMTEAFSRTASDNKCINLYSEGTPDGKEPGVFYRCPGYTLWNTVGIGPIRGTLFNGILFVVSGQSLYRIDYGNILTGPLGTVSGTDPVHMAVNGTQLFISAPSLTAALSTAYVYNYTTGVFTQVVSPNYTTSGSVVFLDGYFVFNQLGTQKVWITALYDGLTIDALDFASAESNPDQISALAVVNGELWVFGDLATEVWADSGNADFPFARIPGANIQQGLAAPNSVFVLDNTVFWLGQNQDGFGQVFRATGYTPTRISTHAIENQIRLSGDSIFYASAYAYQQNGHAFYVLSVNNRTFAYDVSTGLWHERAWLNPVDGTFNRHRAQYHTIFFGDLHIVSDYQTNALYVLSLETYTDNGDEQKWLRTWRALPTGQNTLKNVQHLRLQVDAEMGVGLSGIPATTGENYLSLRETLPISINDFASTPDSAANSITGDMYIVAKILPTNWVPGAVSPIQTKWTTAGNQQSYFFALDSLGRLIFTLDSVGDSTGITAYPSTVVVPGVAGTPLYVAMNFVANNGANSTCTFSYSADGVTFVPLQTVTRAITSIFDSTSDVRVGQIPTGTFSFAGKIYSVLTYAGYSTPLKMSFVANDGTPGFSPMTSIQTGEIWTMNAFGVIAGDYVRETANANPKCMLRWSDDGGFTWSNEHWRSMGAIGKYKNRMVWRKLGSSRDRVYELSGTDAVKVALLSAELELMSGAS